MNLPEITLWGMTINGILTIIIKACIIYLFVRLTTAIVKYIFRRRERRKGRVVFDETKMGFVKSCIVTIVYVIGISSILALIPGMEKVATSLLASAGIGAMTIGLASQDALSNIVGGLFIIFTRPFKVGDFIQVEGSNITGTVKEISLRHTVVCNLENRMILIPNSKMNSSTIINSSHGDTSTCAFVEVGVSYAAPLDRAIEVMREVVMAHPLLIDHRTEEEKAAGVPQVVIRVIDLADSAVVLRAWAWGATSPIAAAMKCDLLKSIKERFDSEGIEIPFPQVTVSHAS